MTDSTVAEAEPEVVEVGAPDAVAKHRKRMTIFRSPQMDGTVNIEPDEMEFLGVDDTLAACFGRLGAGNKGEVSTHTGILYKEPGDTGISLAFAWFKSGYVLPKHSHDADCIYYVTAGSLQMGTQILRKGDGVFVPKDFGYTYVAGPEGVEVLEFRNATKFHIHFKGNDEVHCARMEQAQKDNAEKWLSETVPPSDR